MLERLERLVLLGEPDPTEWLAAHPWSAALLALAVVLLGSVGDLA